MRCRFCAREKPDYTKMILSLSRRLRGIQAEFLMYEYPERFDQIAGPSITSSDAEGGALRSIADWANKLAGAVARLAAILHYAANSNAPNLIQEISAEAVKNAVEIGRYLIPHARAAYSEMGNDPEIEDARKLLRWIESAKSSADSKFTKREAHRANHNAFPKVTDLEPALNLLEAHGYIRNAESRRRDSQNFEINTAVWEPKRKIRTIENGDSSDTSTEVDEPPRTDDGATVTTVTNFGDSDFAHAAGANGFQANVGREVIEI